MDGITFGRASLLCTLLLWVLQVCNGTVTVVVTPKVEVLKGEAASLPCTFTSSSSASSNVIVEWYISLEGQDTRKRVAYRSLTEGGSDEGTRLSGRVTMGEDYTLTINPVQPSDELSLYCQVTAGPSGVGDALTMLKVFHAPQKPDLTRPPSQAITVGESTSSEIGTCVARNGHPQPRIVWFKGDQPLAEIKDRKEKTYMIPSVVKEASGLFTVTSILYMQPTKDDKDSKFYCTVEYSMPGGQNEHKQSDTITINLNYPSETATFTLVNTEPIKEGDTVTMKCETDGNPQPEFAFFKDGNDISGQGAMLTLKSVKRSDAGVYKCEATDYDNLDADLTGEITLTVNYIDPMNVNPAGPLAAMLGDMVEMHCKTKASQPHTVQWKKGSEVLSQTGVLSLKQVSYADAGEYVCVGGVLSVPGLTSQASLNVTVTGKPMIEAPVGGQVEKEGEMVTLQCSAQGHPAPQFTWTPSGKESVSVEDNKVVSTVTLEATAEVMKSGATCQATNEHGSDSKAFSVSLKPTGRSSDNNAADRGRHFSLFLVLSGLFLVQTL